MTGRSFDEVRDLALTSIPGRVLLACASLAARASATSAFARGLRSLAASLGSLSSEQRVRSMALVVGTAALVHGLLIAASPAHVVSALPRSLWFGVALTAVVTALAGRAVAVAWPGSRLRALWRALRQAREGVEAQNTEP